MDGLAVVAPAPPTAVGNANSSSSPLSPSSSSSSSSPTSYTARVSRTCVYPPTIIRIRDPDGPGDAPTSLFQFSLHTAPLTVQRELTAILPALATLNQPDRPLLILPTFQPSAAALTTFTADSEREKNRLLESFSGFARALCQHLTGRGYFADYIDPCTGHPALTPSGGAVYSEVDGASALLRYRMEQAGNCNVILHPTWGSACYPASCVTNARVAAVLEGLERVRRRWEVRDEDELQQRQKHATEPNGQQQQKGDAGSEKLDTIDRTGERLDGEQPQWRQPATDPPCGKSVDEQKTMSEDIALAPRIIPVPTR